MLYGKLAVNDNDLYLKITPDSLLIRGYCIAGFNYCKLFLSLKNSLVVLKSTGDSKNSAMKFGIAIIPLNVSARFHTASIGLTQPTITIAMKMN